MKKLFRKYMPGFLTAFFFLLTLVPAAFPALLDVGPTVPEELNSSPPKHGYPLWYRDGNRVPLEICLSNATSPNVAGASMCNLLPGPAFNPALPISFPGNFPDEAFWFAGDAVIKNGFIRATMVMAIEAAWSTGDITPGNQITFARLRYIVDTPVAGTYRITHPYGQKTFFNVPAGVHAIFDTEDIGIEVGKFSGALQGGVGPFLTWDSGIPINVNGELFIGDPNVEHAITGSPFGTNFFRIEGPAGSNLDGLGNNSVQTNLFAITGKIYTPTIPTSVNGDRVTYARDANGMQLSVFITTNPIANATNPAAPFPANFALINTPSALQVSGTGIPTTALATNTTRDGKFFAVTNSFTDPGDIPATVQITNTADVPPSITNIPLTDEVAISEATYRKVDGILTIAASSSDRVASPALQAFMPGMTAPLGTLVNGQLNVTFPFTDSTVTPAKSYTAPPEKITVRSAAGGSTTAEVEVFLPPTPPPATAATLLANVMSPQVSGTSITFGATGAGGSGTFEFEFWLHDGTAWSKVQPYSSAKSWLWNTAGASAGIYTIQVNIRSAGSTAPFEAFTAMVYQLTAVVTPPAPATGATLSSSPAGSQSVGNPVTFSAGGVGGSGTYEFEFWLHDGTAWSRKQAYSPVSKWVWDTAGAALGNYIIQTNVRSAGSTAAFEGFTTIGYSLTPAVTPPAPATGATIAASPASPKPAGTQFVIFSATGTGGSGSFEFEFWVHNGVSWSKLQAYSPIANFAWDTTGLAAGAYTFQVNVRSAGSTAAFEAFNTMSYELP